MIADKTLVPSIAATSLMTLFSYCMSELEEKNFSEPELLAHIEKKALPKKLSLPAGWATHYTIGILMTLSFNVIWSALRVKPTFQRGLISGSIGGLIAIVSWRILFSALPSRSRNYYSKFYTQLFLAHLVFGLTVTLTQRLIDKKKNSK
jgi:hypothetical protein